MQEELFYIKMNDGKKRPHYKIICKECNKEHFVRLIKTRKKTLFCSTTCFSNYQKKLHVECVCSNCNIHFKVRPNIFYSKKRAKSGLFFCSRKCKDNAQRIGGIKEIQPPHYGTAVKNDYTLAIYRQTWIDNGNKLECKRCGYKEFESSIHIHHIDEDKNNNNISNLISLCANCHFAIHHGHWQI